MKQLPNLKYLQECFNYDPETGIVTWKVRPRNHFASDRTFKFSNETYAGKEITTRNAQGAVVVALMGEKHQIKRIIYKLMMGIEPSGSVININGIKDDNRWENLKLKLPREKTTPVKKYPEILFNRETIHWGNDNIGWYRNTELAKKALGVI